MARIKQSPIDSSNDLKKTKNIKKTNEHTRIK